MQSFTIRLARPSDHEYLSSWTASTFAWGDYIGDAFLGWLDDATGAVFVAEVAGKAVAIGRIHLVTETEAWSSAMRVHADFRRAGLGRAIGQAILKWARDFGARIVRLAVEDWNDAARRQVADAGFRPLGEWLWMQRGVGDASPVPEGNGGKRVRGYEALKLAHAAEAEPALLSWSGGELARHAHGLFATGWTWQRLTHGTLVQAARDQILWEGRPGWALAQRDDSRFLVHWIETNEEDARAMVRTLVERAADSGADTMRTVIPNVGWLVQTFRRAGFDSGGIGVFGRTV